jgi:hypothetical protein
MGRVMRTIFRDTALYARLVGPPTWLHKRPETFTRLARHKAKMDLRRLAQRSRGIRL